MSERAMWPPVYVAGINSDPATGGAPLNVVPAMTSGGNVSVSTAGSYTTFPDHACLQLTISNNTGVVINAQQDGSGESFPVFPGTYYTFYGISNAHQLAVARADGNATSVTVNARWEL